MAKNKQDKRFKKLSQKRDYGLIVLAKRFQKTLFRTAFSKKRIMGKLRLLWQRKQDGQDLDPILLDYSIEDKKIEKFEKEAKNFYSKTLDKGGSKIFTPSGDYAKNIKKPTYENESEQMKNRGLRLIKDLNEDQKTKIKDELEKGFKKGLSYTDVSKNVSKRIKSISESRAKLIASTEMNLAVNKGMESTMQYNGINFYHYITAGDNRVAEICHMNSKGTKDGSGKLLKHTVGQGPLPVQNSHPRCRCSVVKARD